MQDLNPQSNRRTVFWIVMALAIVVAIVVLVVPVFKIITMMSGTYAIDTVEFTLVDPSTATSGIAGSSEPGIWIDTNVEVKIWQKKIESRKPYSIAIDKTDDSATYASAVFTKVDITYYDGSVETSRPQLPLILKAEDYSITNSVSGGRIVTTTTRGIHGRIPDVITRDEPFTLQLEGHFLLDDGNRIPFHIQQEYDVRIDQSKKAAKDVMQDR